MEIHHNTDHFFLYIVVITIISIVGFISVSYSSEQQRVFDNASRTLGIILLIITGVLLSIYGYQEYKREDKIHGIISSIA